MIQRNQVPVNIWSIQTTRDNVFHFKSINISLTMKLPEFVCFDILSHLYVVLFTTFLAIMLQIPYSVPFSHQDAKIAHFLNSNDSSILLKRKIFLFIMIEAKLKCYNMFLEYHEE